MNAEMIAKALGINLEEIEREAKEAYQIVITRLDDFEGRISALEKKLDGLEAV